MPRSSAIPAAAGSTESIAPRRISPVLVWAGIGAVFAAFECYVWARWIGSDNFAPRPVDVDSVPELTRQVIHVTQVISPIVCAFIMLKFLVAPLIRERRFTLDGMLVVSYFTLWFQDPMGNLASTQLYYSSYWINMGSWTLGSLPGWISPAGNHLPEPILVMGFGYLWLGFLAGMSAFWLMRRIRDRFPRCSALELSLAALALCVVLDIVAETALAAAGTFAWPGAIKGLSLFHGKPYQFPMYEGLLFGAVIASGGVLRFFRDDKGLTLVERGVDKLSLPQPTRTTLRFFAVYGFMHLFMAVVYSIPMIGFGMISDPFLRYPSHLENGMCVLGPQQDQCPGPGIAMPRPPYP
ncbi:spirocyclase AveC family protein [Hydrocarboniphaga sp.]|uniref:spirocyclase AveC family protein n=1 Tax=Hydrocarboniphaga sp. TaxID=2033016 RepID=UPI003D136188